MMVCNSRKRASSTMLALTLAFIQASLVKAQQSQSDLIEVQTSGIPTNKSEPIHSLLGPPLFISKDIGNAKATTDAAIPLVSATATAEPQDAVPNQMAQILNEHNKYRALHGAKPLTWNRALGNQAASWARGCDLQHSQSNGLYGENLFLTSERGAAAIPGALLDAITGWYEEVQDYDFSKPGFSMETGHFTQVVWKWSTQLGCGVRNCPTVGSVSGFDNGGIMVVCRYKPPGNFEGKFRQNVLPARRKGTVGVNTNAILGDTPAPFNNLPPFSLSSAITAEQGLQGGQCIDSSNGKYRLCVTKTGLIEVHNIASGRRTWSSGVAGPTDGAEPFRLGVTLSGDLVAEDSQNRVHWQTKTSESGTAPFVLTLRDTGNLALYDSKAKCLWSIKGNCA